MGPKRTDEFRQNAVRIALNSGLTGRQLADDLGVGMSTLNQRMPAHGDTDMVSKKATQFFAGLKPRGLSSSRNTDQAFQPIGCVRSSASVHACQPPTAI